MHSAGGEGWGGRGVSWPRAACIMHQHGLLHSSSNVLQRVYVYRSYIHISSVCSGRCCIITQNTDCRIQGVRFVRFWSRARPACSIQIQGQNTTPVSSKRGQLSVSQTAEPRYRGIEAQTHHPQSATRATYRRCARIRHCLGPCAIGMPVARRETLLSYCRYAG